MIVARNTILSIFFFFWCKLFLWIFFWWCKVSGILWGVQQICNGSTESCLKAVENFGGDIYKVMLHSWSSSSSDDAKFSRSCVKLQHICNHYWLIYWGVWIFAFSMACCTMCQSCFLSQAPFLSSLAFPLSHSQVPQDHKLCLPLVPWCNLLLLLCCPPPLLLVHLYKEMWQVLKLWCRWSHFQEVALVSFKRMAAGLWGYFAAAGKQDSGREET